MFWAKEKLAARIKDLEAFRYRDSIEITGMKMKLDVDGQIGEYPSVDGEWNEISLGDRWTGRDLYRWLSFDAEIPSEWAGKRVFGRFNFGRTGGGNNSGFESLLFLNGAPYQGVDSNHEEVYITPELIGSKVKFQFRLWSGLNGYGKAEPIENQIQLAKLCWLDEAADDLYYTSRAVLETIGQLQENRPEHHELLKALDRAFLLLDWSEPGSEVFYASVAEARNDLRQQLAQMPNHHPVHVYCIGHTHIDVAWLWRLKHTREKAARSFSTVLRLMEQYPDYVFLQTQPQLYEYIKTDYPAIYEQIKERVAEGRWEAGGGMWLEADCNLVSGESLVRQLLYGTRFFKDEFGVECRYLWLPDVFGYSWALPQILLKSGIDMFMTTKISWNQYNRMPHDTFKWRGIDGSEVLTHFITTPDPGTGEGSFYYTYNGSVTPASVQGIWDGYRDKEINQELLLSYGYGDGGGGVNSEMLEMRRRLEHMPGLPKAKTGRADAYFDRLKEEIAQTDRYVHTWNGELYLELHRGTYTSQAYNKRANRKLELLYRETEWIAALHAIHAADWANYPLEEIYKGWKIVLRNQFHDIIPGSSIGEVYEDCRIEYAEAYSIADRVWEQAAAGVADREAGEADQPEATEVQAVSAVAQKEGAEVQAAGTADAYVVLFNSASWSREDNVRIQAKQGMEQGVWKDADGNELTAQFSEGYWQVDVSNMPSMGYTTLRFTPGPEQAEQVQSPFQRTEKGITTPFYDLEWNEKGQLTKLYDRAAGRHVLAEGAFGNVLQVFEDKPKGRHEAWDIDLFYQEKQQEISELTRIEVAEVGPVRAVIRMEWTYRNSSIQQKMIVYANHRRIDFETKVDWHEQRQLLKVAFPVNIHASEATYDIQFGNVTRPTHWNTSWDYARFESVGHQWADLSERNYGVSLMNDCKYGYDIKDNVLRLSLIKSAIVPDPKADQGEHEFIYSLFPHEGDWLQGGTVQAAWSLNNPVSSKYGKSVKPKFSLCTLSADHVMVDAVKKAEDHPAFILRLHEFAGMRGRVTISSDASIVGWQETNLMESPLEDVKQEGAISFEISPYEIKSILLYVNEE